MKTRIKKKQKQKQAKIAVPKNVVGIKQLTALDVTTSPTQTAEWTRGVRINFAIPAILYYHMRGGKDLEIQIGGENPGNWIPGGKFESGNMADLTIRGNLIF